MASPLEPLELSAPLARALARRSCESCAWYHGVWQYLRLLEVIEPMARHAAFFERELSSVDSSRGPPRILICGAADYWMYARVLDAYRKRRVKPMVTVVDLCATPLALNRWYAQRAGAQVITRRCDILAFTSSRRFDAICTHAVLGRFSPERRRALAAKWHSLLRPGAVVVTVTPLRRGDVRSQVRFTSEQARALAGAVREAATARRRDLNLDPDVIAAEARTYAERHQVHRVQSRAELRSLFESAGFVLDRLSRVPAASQTRSLGGPTVAGAAYGRVVARRA